jgi:Holliday junction DNA helicase RuvA
MIGKLTGVVDSVFEDHIILEVSGVGYIVHLTSSAIASCSPGKPLSLLIHSVTREDGTILIGFNDEISKRWFTILQSVQGVGVKMALSILSAMGVNDIVNSVISEDINSFKQISGIGPKLASRLINELKTRKDLVPQVLIGSNTTVTSLKTTNSVSDVSKISDAISALENLGFDRKNSFLIVSEIANENADIKLEDLITRALKRM